MVRIGTINWPDRAAKIGIIRVGSPGENVSFVSAKVASLSVHKPMTPSIRTAFDWLNLNLILNFSLHSWFYIKILNSKYGSNYGSSDSILSSNYPF